MPTVTLEKVTRRYDGRAALDRLDLRLPNGRTSVVLGPSGSGKTTLLKVIAGLETPDEGKVFFDTDDVTRVPPRDRGLGMVFQDFALYPRMTNRNNVLAWFLFRGRRPELDPEAEARFARTAELMGVELEKLLERRPAGLSPGEQQRVALARCITREPRLFLLDEPLAHLDASVRHRYRANLKRLLQEFRITTVYVTHDQAEAPILADHVVLLRDGRVAQAGPFPELYRMPIDLFVAGFLNPDPLAPAIGFLPGDAVAREFAGTRLGVRPEDAEIALEPPRDGYGVEVEVIERIPVPSRKADLVRARVGDDEVHAYLTPPTVRLPGRVWFWLERFHVFDPDSGRRQRTVP